MNAIEPTATELFTQLEPILSGRTLLITVAKGTGDALTVNVIPKGADAQENGALKAPLCLTGTAEELDREWLTQLQSFVEAHEGLSSNLAEIKAEMEQAEKEARARKPQPGRKVSHRRRRLHRNLRSRRFLRR